MISNTNVRNRINRKKHILRKKRLNEVLTSALLMTITFITILNISLAVAKPDLSNAEKIVIKPGDTIWSIAKNYNYEKKDIRVIVDEIIKYNDIDAGNLLPGTEIIIPL